MRTDHDGSNLGRPATLWPAAAPLTDPVVTNATVTRIDRSVGGKEIRRFRVDAELTQEALAERLGIGVKTVQRYERLGAPRWVRYALAGLGAFELGLDGESLEVVRRIESLKPAEG